MRDLIIFFFNDTATTEIYTLSLHDALPISQETPGYTRGPAYDKLGWRASDQHPLYFEDCRVPEENLLGERGEGLRQFLQTLDGGRVAVAALSVGLAQACFDEALARAQVRRQFGKAIAEFQAIQFKLADKIGRASCRERV